MESFNGRGGALCVLSGVVQLKDCLLHGNYAKMASAYDALGATGGAIAIADGGALEMQGSQLWDNDAPGSDSMNPSSRLELAHRSHPKPTSTPGLRISTVRAEPYSIAVHYQAATRSSLRHS